MNAVERIRRTSDAPSRARRVLRARADRVRRVADGSSALNLAGLPRALFGGDLLDLLGRRLRERLEPPAASLPEDAPRSAVRGDPDLSPTLSSSTAAPPPRPDRASDGRPQDFGRETPAPRADVRSDLATTPAAARVRTGDPRPRGLAGRADRVVGLADRADPSRRHALPDAVTAPTKGRHVRSPAGRALAARLRAYLDAAGVVGGGVPVAGSRTDAGRPHVGRGTAARSTPTAVNPVGCVQSAEAGHDPPRERTFDSRATDGAGGPRPWWGNVSLAPPTPRDTARRELHAMTHPDDDLAFRMAEVLREEARRHGVPLT